MGLDPSDHQLHTCFNYDLSDVGQLRFDRAFDDLPCKTWLRKGAPIKIGRAKEKEERGSVSGGSWLALSAQSSPSNRSSSD